MGDGEAGGRVSDCAPSRDCARVRRKEVLRQSFYRDPITRLLHWGDRHLTGPSSPPARISRIAPATFWHLLLRGKLAGKEGEGRDFVEGREKKVVMQRRREMMQLQPRPMGELKV
ncbi:Hypothetical protein NTJ_07004 [Nesidiocoris tenuis]|uniref:Uncharacterized protein n=1 Tax=Nesidiocoris tenuis TaxID=355587 RepID=A0ABN7APQ1_9HEMI|nr:Hypothetical protein NTJ_07004 [Nesidiocoris tenuis]